MEGTAKKGQRKNLDELDSDLQANPDLLVGLVPIWTQGILLGSGRAWRTRIPKDSVLCRSLVINNLLEFLGMAVNV